MTHAYQWCVKSARAASTALHPIVRGTLDIALATLDVCDSKFAWVGYNVRRMLGWAALAMIVASGAIVAHSLS